MKNLIASLLFLFLVNMVHGQNKVNISLEGSVTNFSTSEKLFGATLYMMQNGKTVSKSISDETGRYSISGLILIEKPIDLLISKPGYASKKVLFDINSLKVSNGKSTNLQLLEELIVELYENRTGANLSFTKTDYAEKFTWDQSAFIAKPDQKYKSEIDKKVTDEYAKVKNNGTSKNYVSRGEIAYKNREFEKAVAYYDSALVATPTDSTIRIKKENVLSTINRIKEEETKKANYNTKKTLADNSFASGDILNAEKFYKDLLSEFPADPYATAQLTKITVTKNQLEIEKKNKAEADKLMAQALTLKNSKKYNEAIQKIQQAITFLPNKKDDYNKEIDLIKAIQSDILLEAQINKELKIAVILLKEKKYDDAINTYKKIDQSIEKLSTQPLVDKYSNLSQQGAKTVLDKNNLERMEFKKQLQKAQDNFDKGPAFYTDAEKILKGDPMKSRKNDPELLELSDKIVKMKEFYKQKNEAYKEVKNKKNNEALTKLKSTREYAKKLGSIAPQTEFSKLNSSIDSLESILKPVNTPPPTPQPTNNQIPAGFQLSAPGEIVTDNPNDVFNELSNNIDAKKSAPFENLTEIKNDIDKEADFNKKLNASRQEDEIKSFQDKKTEIELKATEQSKVPVQLQEILN
jgi:tetratricopeptide (TPR) repeat protein